MPSPIRYRQIYQAPADGGGALWFPIDLDVLTQWYDPTTGVTTAGSTVTAYEDQSGNGFDLDGTGHAPDHSTTSFNSSYAGITFDAAASEYLDRTSTLPDFWNSASPANSWFMTQDGNLAGFKGLMSEGSTTTTQCYSLLTTNASSQARPFVVAAGGTNHTTSYGSDPFDATPNLIGAIDDGGDCDLFLDGAASGSTSSYTPSGTISTNISFGIGVRFYNGTGSHPSTVVGEVITSKSVLDTDDRQYVEGFMAHNGGIQGNLDSGHPWKSSPPTATALHLERRMDINGTLWPVPRDVVEDRAPLIVPRRKLIIPDTGWKLAA